MSKHPPLRPGEVFVGNVIKGDNLSDALSDVYRDLSPSFRSPAYDIDGNVIDGFLALILSDADAKIWNSRMEAHLAAIRRSGSK